MGLALEFEKEKLIMGFIFNSDSVFEEALSIIKERFGEIDFSTEEFSFSREFSDYYDSELGGEGRRIIVSFQNVYKRN